MFESWHSNDHTAVFRLVVQKLRRESAHARTFGGDFGLKILRMRGFSSRFLDNQPENCCTTQPELNMIFSVLATSS